MFAADELAVSVPVGQTFEPKDLCRPPGKVTVKCVAQGGRGRA